ncbi:site-2 protease family protein [Salisaeta longa]|uniref:site-2 protease family protein n=1 Tax=Salisaeta longa TaxID=503170 RepID=UPI0004061E08|nr:site-2 protease family protein [Salisaeta longa]
MRPFSTAPSDASAASSAAPPRNRYWLHALLFVLTVVSTIYAGAQWASRVLLYNDMGWWLAVVDGLRYAVPLVGFLTVHEFGHYFASRHHRINASLPYYIPFPFNGIGNFGAVIRIRDPIPSTRILFDIGAAGPLAGFVVALGVLLYGFATLPGPEYLLTQPGHEALKAYIQQHGAFPAERLPAQSATVILIGQTPLFWFLSQFFAHVPPMYEIYHYPVLFAGWLGLFFTALNLLPVGQLDGGHILYALFGRRWHRRLARGFVLLLLWSGGIGFMDDIRPWLAEQSVWLGEGAWILMAGLFYGLLYRIMNGAHEHIAPSLAGLLLAVGGARWLGITHIGYTGWFLWVLIIIFLVRVEHPPVRYEQPLTRRQRYLGYACIAIFLLCFSFQPITVA